MTILIAEDEEILIRVLKEEFEAEGFKVVLAKDGEEALKAMASSKPDIALLDLLMPVKDGFAVLEEMSSYGGGKAANVPVIVLSNLGQDDDIKRAFKLGAVDYFVKSQHPVSEVVEKVKSFLGGGAFVASKRVAVVRPEPKAEPKIISEKKIVKEEARTEAKKESKPASKGFLGGFFGGKKIVEDKKTESVDLPEPPAPSKPKAKKEDKTGKPEIA